MQMVVEGQGRARERARDRESPGMPAVAMVSPLPRIKLLSAHATLG